MKAMIMAAGVGSRLMPMTREIPKPMVPMVNRPLMDHTVQLLHKHGFNSIIANLHYHGDCISGYFGDGSGFGVSLNYSREEKLLGTAGGVKRCQWFLDDTFVIISGDALTDINLSRLVRIHKEKGALATIALKEVEDVESFGIVITDEDGLIKSFQEKPRPAEALSKLANTGIYVFEPEVFRYIPAGQFYDFGKQLFPYLVSRACPFYGAVIDQYWCDIGNLDTYRQSHADVLVGKVDLALEGEVMSGERKSRVLLGDGVTLGKNVELEGCVTIGPGCRVGDNVRITDAVLWDEIEIGPEVCIDRAVVGSKCTLKPGTIIRAGTAIASHSSL